MNNHSDEAKNFVSAENYYPKSITLGKNAQPFFEQSTPDPSIFQKENTQTHWQNNPQFAQNEHSPHNQNPLQSLLSNLFSQNNLLLSQLLNGNPLLSMLFSGKQNQNELMTNLLGSLMQKQDSKEKEEKVIDLKNSVEEF